MSGYAIILDDIDRLGERRIARVSTRELDLKFRMVLFPAPAQPSTSGPRGRKRWAHRDRHAENGRSAAGEPQLNAYHENSVYRTEFSWYLFLVLGSASPDLLRQTTETLAGRIAYYELPGFALREIGTRHLDRLWVRGGFPRSFLSRSDVASVEWRQEFMRTFLERDLPTLGVSIAADTMRRFWSMLAHRHAQLWNASEIGRSFGVADTTVRGYLDKLTDALVVRQLKPWHENISKRQVKAPKIYIRDSGLLHALLNLVTQRDIEGHPKLGASWEGYVIGQIVQQLGVRSDEVYYWRTHTGAELDLLVVRGRTRIGFEVKRTAAPAVTPSMRSSMRDLKLKSLTILHAGRESFALTKNIRAVAAAALIDEIAPLR